MGLFGKMFEKKVCDVCGNEIKLLGNRKLEDGNLCKECAKKLSPWFDERRHSTVESIKKQLGYREENKNAVASFRSTRTYGETTIIHIDEDNKKFLVSKTGKIQSENPDVLDFSQVTGCNLDIDESKTEIMKKKNDGTEVRYNPPRYTYHYDFHIIIRVNHPYFDTIKFKLNRSTVNVDSEAMNNTHSMNTQQFVGNLVGSMLGANISFNPTQSIEYQQYEKMGNEIISALTNARQEARDAVAAANAPKENVACPCCGARTVPNADGCCEFCGCTIN